MTERDDDYRYSVCWLDLLARGRFLGRGISPRPPRPRRRPASRGPPRPVALPAPAGIRVPRGVPSAY